MSREAAVPAWREVLARGSVLPLVLFSLALPADGADGQGAWTGQRLMAACAPDGGSAPSRDCAVYIRSIVDRYHEMLAETCPHTQTSFAILVGDVTAYLAEHRPELDRPGPDLVLDSLGEAFHCGPLRR